MPRVMLIGILQDMKIRNRTGIQWAPLRARMDEAIEDMHDELESAYYDHWRHGEPCYYYGFDVRLTIAASKRQFNLLHGALFHIYTILMYRMNEIYGDYSSTELFATYDNDGEITDYLGRVNRSRVWLEAKSVKHRLDLRQIRTHVAQWIKARHNRTLDLS